MNKGGWLRLIVLACLAGTGRAEMTFFAHSGKLSTVAMIGEGKQLGTGTVGVIDSMGDKKYGDFWNIEFSGLLEVKTAGSYEFEVASDDGSALYVNGQPVVMNDGLHGTVSRKGSIELPVGKHQVNLLYFNHIGGHALKATVKAPGGQAGELAAACTPSSKRQDMGEMREKARQREAAEAQKALISISSPEALVRSIRHILKTKPRAYKNGREYLKKAEAFVANMPALLERIEKGDAEAIKELAAFSDLKFKALVAENPYVDFDEILVVLSDRVALKANWLGAHTLTPKGYKNKIARVNLRTRRSPTS